MVDSDLFTGLALCVTAPTSCSRAFFWPRQARKKSLMAVFAIGRACLWGPERYGVVAITVGAPILLCMLFVLRVNNKVARALVAVVSGLCAAGWVQFLPCLSMICDGGYEDDPELRFILLFVTGPVWAVACFGFCGGHRVATDAKIVRGVPTVDAVRGVPIVDAV